MDDNGRIVNGSHHKDTTNLHNYMYTHHLLLWGDGDTGEVKGMATTEKRKRKADNKDVSNPVGRPKKFETVEQLETLIEQYFESCSEEVWRRKIDIDGVPTDEWEPVLDRFGNITKRLSKPYTVSGLAIFLGTTRRTLMDYEQQGDEFSHTIKNAKARCEEFAEEQLFTSKNTAGVIFNMVNNYGWNNKQEVNANHTGGLNNTTQDITNLSPDERRARINELNRRRGTGTDSASGS